ncbi:MAG: hypothetical protein ABSF90_11970 [Syntrophobacteraceae bacterium]|jgi:hypothetical protein
MISGSRIQRHAGPIATIPVGDEIVEKSLTYLKPDCVRKILQIAKTQKSGGKFPLNLQCLFAGHSVHDLKPAGIEIYLYDRSVPPEGLES